MIADKFTIVIRRYQQYGLNGDRASTKTAYWDYKVVSIRDDGQEMVLAEYPGYDGFFSHIVPDRLDEAAEYANAVRVHLNAEGGKLEEYIPREVVSTVWEKQP